jgi:hypothetical protein
MKQTMIAILFTLAAGTACAQPMEDPIPGPEQVARALLVAYNEGDLDGIARLFSDSASLYVLPSTNPVYTGREAIRSAYADQLENNCMGTLRQPCPDLKGVIVSQQTVGRFVATVELVTLVASKPALRYMITYEVVNGQIRNAWFMPEG